MHKKTPRMTVSNSSEAFLIRVNLFSTRLLHHDLASGAVTHAQNVQTTLHAVELLSIQLVGIYYLHVLTHLLNSNASTIVVLLDVGEAIPCFHPLISRLLASWNIQRCLSISIGVECVLINRENVLYLTIYRLEGTTAPECFKC